MPDHITCSEIRIRPLKAIESHAVYQMFHSIPQKENDAENKAANLTIKEFRDFCKQAVLNAKGEKLAKGRVPQITYLIFDGETPVGFGKFRPVMNKFCIQSRIFNFAYMIVPKFRGRGYATKFIDFLKKEAQKYGLKEIRGSARTDNKGSCRVMEKNGGILENDQNNESTYVIPTEIT